MGKRMLTAAVGLPVFIGIMYMGGFYLKALVTAMVVIGIYELFKMMVVRETKLAGFIMFYSAFLVLFADPVYLVPMISIFTLLVFLYLVGTFSGDPVNNSGRFQVLLQGIFIFFYVTVPLYHIVLIRNVDNGFYYLLFMFFIIWSTDSFAYFTGRMFGKNKLAPLISPKKTIEGAVGGSLCAVVISLAVSHYYGLFTDISVVLLGISVLFLTVVSQTGDLFESSIKRIYNSKDSGNLLPGHGGILDRFDSTIFVAPVFYYLLILVIK